MVEYKQLSNKTFALADENVLVSRYAGYKLFTLLEKDLLTIFKGKNKRSIKFHFKSLISSFRSSFFRKIPFPSIDDNILKSVDTKTIIFSPTIENNLNSMLPIAVQLKEIGFNCLFVFNDLSAKKWKNFQYISSFGTILYAKDIHLSWSSEAESALKDWENDIIEMLIKLKYKKNNIFKRTHFTFNAKRIAKNFLSMAEGFRILFDKHTPYCIIAPRPKRFIPLTLLMAAKFENIPTIFMTHTTWFNKMTDMFRLYDLDCFDGAVMYTKMCASDVKKRNKNIKIHVSGWPTSIKMENDFPFTKREDKIVVGYPAGRDYNFISKMAEVISSSDVELHIKCHPPGGDKNKILSVIQSKKNIHIWDHSEIKLSDFLSMIDVLICGKSNVGVEAATMGVPVISFYSDFEKKVGLFRRRSVESIDISLWKVNTIEELKMLLKDISDFVWTDIVKYSIMQRKKIGNIVEPYDVKNIADFIIQIANDRKFTSKNMRN